MEGVTWILVAVVIVALIFDYTNGFHDAANAIATSIGTRALRPTTALAMAAVLNVVGGLIYETKVAKTITEIVPEGIATQEMVLAALLGAIAWNLLTWWFGIPSSSSHALIGGLVGAALAATFDSGSVLWGTIVKKVVVPTIASPIVGLVLAALVTAVVYRLVHGGTSLVEVAIVRTASFVLFTAFFMFLGHLLVALPVEWVSAKWLGGAVTVPWWLLSIPSAGASGFVMRGVIGKGPRDVNGRFRLLQTLSAGYMALEHGHNDAQKTMGIITVALVAAGQAQAGTVPLWVKLACALVIGLGTFSGGKRIIKTMGMKLVKLEPIDGFAAETVAATVIQFAGRLGMPISTTHAITAAITGVGATKRISAVRWGVTANILVAWVITLPAAALVAALFYALLRPLT